MTRVYGLLLHSYTMIFSQEYTGKSSYKCIQLYKNSSPCMSTCCAGAVHIQPKCTRRACAEEARPARRSSQGSSCGRLWKSPGVFLNEVAFKTLGLFPGTALQEGRWRALDGNRYVVRQMTCVHRHGLQLDNLAVIMHPTTLDEQCQLLFCGLSVHAATQSIGCREFFGKGGSVASDRSS